ncbi:MAG: Na+-transporting NADH:ubiquinone oxidoreductase subunit A [Salibacteraceae bacterium]|jgi:Na+-transporting NADH:ubiquinone oxidoreductase subunit A
MSKHINIKRGLDIKLDGAAEKVTSESSANVFALKPTDFTGVSPKLVLKEGAKVEAGTAVFFDKNKPAVQFCSPVSGEITEIKRGEKRKILEVIISSDSSSSYKKFSPKSGSRQEVIDSLCESGMWPFIKQRPFDVMANPEDMPKSIFVTAFNTEPLTADFDYTLYGQDVDFQKGLDVLAMLTEGDVHLNIHSERTASNMFKSAKNVVTNTFSGAHPSGNVGIQLNKVQPINKGETVWTLNALGVTTIGKFYNSGKFDVSRLVALAGGKVTKPKYVKSIAGAQVSSITSGNMDSDNARLISGGILTGSKVENEGFLGFYDSTVTVIEEGNQTEFLGWILPSRTKFSMSRTFFSYLSPGKSYNLDTNLHGENRSYVMTNQYEKVFPMDIYPVQLIKSCLAYDLEKMEALGIYEVAPEDFALCEFVCTSKTEVQDIIRTTLDRALIDLA